MEHQLLFAVCAESTHSPAKSRSRLSLIGSSKTSFKCFSPPLPPLPSLRRAEHYTCVEGRPRLSKTGRAVSIRAVAQFRPSVSPEQGEWGPCHGEGPERAHAVFPCKAQRVPPTDFALH